MTARIEEPPPGWLTLFRRGVFSGVLVLAAALLLCAIPCCLVWFLPGSDTAPAISAVKAAALLALSAAHGGLVLDGLTISIPPLVISVLLGWLIAGQARRTRSWSAILGMGVGYGAASAALAGWAQLGSAHAPVAASAVAGLLFVWVVGLGARAYDVFADRLAPRWRAIGRAAVGGVTASLVLSALTVAIALGMHLSAATGLQRQLASGIAGLPVALLGVAAAPNAVLAATGYLTGAGFAVGSQTSVSPFAVSHGRLPVFPLLAAVPGGRPAPLIGLLAALLLALAVGGVLHRLLPSGTSWVGHLTDCAIASALVGATLAALVGFAAGGLGSGPFRHVGANWWAVGFGAGLLSLFGSAIWVGASLLRPRAAAIETATLQRVRLHAVRRPADDPAPEPDAEPTRNRRNAS